MKIIHILLGKANPETMNGVNKVVHHLATELHNLAHNVEVWGLTNNPEPVKHHHEYTLRLFRRTSARFFLSKAIVNAIDTEGTECIFHLHSVYIPEFHSIARRLTARKVPWVLSPHAGYTSTPRARMHLIKYAYYHLFDRMILAKAKVLHATGASEQIALANRAPATRIELIPNGQKLLDAAAMKSAVKGTELWFGYCGRLDLRHKGLDLLIQGFTIYKSAGGFGRLSIVGDGVDKRILQDLVIRNAIVEYVRFHGAKFAHQKLASLQEMDVFLHPSRWDGMPMAALEAASLGLPLLVSRATNLADQVERYGGGSVLERNDPTEIAQLLREYELKWKRSELPAIGRAARKMVEEENSWRRIARRFADEIYA